jgi:acyl-CoA synthetase (AMP-forming)/AMP-acid ligase II
MITTNDYFIDPAAFFPRYRSHGYTLAAVFDAAVALHGDEPAVFDQARFRTWNEWASDAHALARAFQELGVGAGDVVALHLPNCWEYLVGHIALGAIGAVMFPIPMAYGEHELRVLLERSSAAVLVIPTSYHQQNLLEMGQRLLSALPSLQRLIIAGDEQSAAIPGIARLLRQWAGALPRPVRVAPDDPIALLASSGTTSLRPKICLHTHDGLLANAAMTGLEARARADDTVISASPLVHLFGLLSIHLSLFSAGRQALLPRWNVEEFLIAVQKSRATVAFLVPAQLRDVCTYLETHPGIPRSTLREIRTGGAKVPATLVADTRRLLGASVIVQWGMSEVGSGIFTRPDDPAEAASRSMGKPVMHGEAHIVDINSDILPTGETGELWYRSPYLFRGYLHDQELTRAAVTADGWLRTGDLASCEADGMITYQGRFTELINRGGLKFSAVEVESLLSELPQLEQFAIISQPDARLGERSALVAAVRVGQTITLAEVTAHLAARGLARYKWPEDLILIETLPTTPTGKIARVRLLEQLQTNVD